MLMWHRKVISTWCAVAATAGADIFGILKCLKKKKKMMMKEN